MQQPFSNIALVPGDLQQLLIKAPKSWCGSWKKLLSTFPSLFLLITGIIQQLFQGASVVAVYFPYKGHSKISAVHAKGLWDMVNQCRGLWFQWAVLLLVWPERFKTLWLLTPFPCWQLSSTQPNSANKSLMYHIYPRELCQRVFNSGIQVRASDNICHSFQYPTTFPFLLGALFMHVGCGITHGWDFFSLKMRYCHTCHRRSNEAFQYTSPEVLTS